VTRTFFITGSDTGVGKTVLTVLLARHLRAGGVRVRAVKPLCSGGRDDAAALRVAQGGELTLDEINPWHFRAALAPLVAARRERRKVRPADVRRFLREAAAKADVLLIEGAGGLLSPLGEDFDARDLIVPFWATPLIVVPDRLGAINQALLVVSSLPAAVAPRAQIVLSATVTPDGSARTNLGILGEKLGKERVHHLPRLSSGELNGNGSAELPRGVLSVLEKLIGG
jgi:dethiobiotin synthetase